MSKIIDKSSHLQHHEHLENTAKMHKLEKFNNIFRVNSHHHKETMILTLAGYLSPLGFEDSLSDIVKTQIE